MPNRITPSLGPDLNYVGAKPWFDINASTISPALGTKVIGNDGRHYVLVQASAGIAANTAVIITEPAMTVAAGAGPYSTQATAPTTGQYLWVRANTL